MSLEQMQQTSFAERYGPWALVTGAARGIGAEFASQLAARGLGLVLLDRLADELEALAGALRRSGPVNVRTVVADLARPEFMSAVLRATEDLELGLLVSNAGISPVGPFFGRSLAQDEELLAISCRAPLALVHTLGRPMRDRGRGGLILLSSCAALQGAPLAASYAAAKAFNLVLGEGLWDELRDDGVDVLVLAPGLTETPGMAHTAPDRGSLAGSTIMPVEPVVRGALEALGRRPVQIPGLGNRLASALLPRLLPRRLAVSLLGRGMRGLYPRFGRR